MANSPLNIQSPAPSDPVEQNIVLKKNNNSEVDNHPAIEIEIKVDKVLCKLSSYKMHVICYIIQFSLIFQVNCV